jgi:O-antigen ligase
VVVSAAAAACVFPLVQALSFDPLWGFNSLHRVVPQAGVGTIDQYSSSRVQFWQWTWQDIVSRPWIGHGEGQFGWMISDRTGTFYNHPHNVVLQMLYEWGALGFCAVAMLVRPVLWRLRDMDRSSLRRASAHICGLVALASMAILDGSLYYALPVLFALLFLTGLAAAQQPPAPEEIIGSCGEAAAS